MTTTTTEPPLTIDRLWNDRGPHYLEDEGLRVDFRANTWDAEITLQDVSQAMQPGKVAEGFTLRCLNDAFDDGKGFGRLQEMMRSHLDPDAPQFRPLFEWLLSLEWIPDGIFGFKTIRPDLTKAEIYRRQTKTVRVYAPFAKVRPLPTMPAKWTVALVIRALWNVQFTALNCNGVYTDDYAYDNAVNYHQGPIANARGFCKRLIESPSGWWASKQPDAGGVVSICCHHFDSNEFKPRIP